MNPQKKKLIWMYGFIVLILSIIFYIGIFSNPNFDLHDFCMGLSTEIIGLVIAVGIIDRYIKEREKR